MLAAMPDGYQKTVGFPTYDLLAAASIPMEELAEELARTREMLDPSTLTGTDLDNYIKSRSGLVRNPATCASGVLQVTGTGTITAGDLFESGGGIQFAGHPFRIPFRLGCFQGLKQLRRFFAAFQGCLIIPLLLLPCRARQGKVGFVKSVSGIAKGRCSRQEHAEQGTG